MPSVQDDAKVTILLRDDLAPWQIANVSTFLASGITAQRPDLVGDPYEDGDGNQYLRLLGVPATILVGDAAVLQRSLRRSRERGLDAALYTADMFSTMNDTQNREAVSGRPADALDVVGVGVVGPARDVDRALDKGRRHP